MRRDIDLPLDPPVASESAAEAADHARDYEVRTWRDAVPDELLEDQANLHRRMSTEIPQAEMDGQEEEWDAARVRREEAHVQAMDRSYVAGGAVHRSTGRLVAYTTTGIGARRSGRTSGTPSC